MKEKELICAQCGERFKKKKVEYDRQKREGRDYFFCSLSCVAYWRNLHKEHYAKTEVRFCPECGGVFAVKESSKKKYCSNSCASKASLTSQGKKKQARAGREHKDNLLSVRETMLKRESDKYKELKNYLVRKDIPYKFEFELEDYLYDLYLPDLNKLIEFDGSYHTSLSQIETDAWKDNLAKKKGFQIIRIPVEDGKVISPELIKGIVSSQS